MFRCVKIIITKNIIFKNIMTTFKEQINGNARHTLYFMYIFPQNIINY